jgi:hypothetical protein
MITQRKPSGLAVDNRTVGIHLFPFKRQCFMYMGDPMRAYWKAGNYREQMFTPERARRAIGFTYPMSGPLIIKCLDVPALYLPRDWVDRSGKDGELVIDRLIEDGLIILPLLKHVYSNDEQFFEGKPDRFWGSKVEYKTETYRPTMNLCIEYAVEWDGDWGESLHAMRAT